MFRSSPFLQLYRARLREFYRQPARIFWVYGFPTVLAVVLGLAFQNRPPAPVTADLVRNSFSPPIEQAIRKYNEKSSGIPERSVRAEMAGSGASSRPSVELKVLEQEESLRRLNTGRTPLVILPTDQKSWIYRYDPTRPEAVAARQTVDDVLQQAAGRINPRQSRDELVTEPGSRYIDFLIPGLIGVNAMGGGLWGIGFFLVNLRIGKLLKCFVATPMPRRDFLGAIIASRLTFLIPDLIVLLLLGTLAFGMPIRGNLLLVILVDVIGALAFAGIGLLVASRATTTETVSGLMNLVMLPQWLFAGVFFSSERFPAVVQPFIQALPLTQLVTGLRRVILEGAGLVGIGNSLVILVAWAVVTFYLALRLFRWP